jgi:hypothetical protein
LAPTRVTRSNDRFNMTRWIVQQDAVLDEIQSFVKYPKPDK